MTYLAQLVDEQPRFTPGRAPIRREDREVADQPAAPTSPRRRGRPPKYPQEEAAPEIAAAPER